VDAKAGLNAVFFVDGKNGWAAGDKGLCVATDDGGMTWHKLDMRSSATLRGIFFRDAKTGWICGDSDPNAPQARGHIVIGGSRPANASTVFRTPDGGKTWFRSDLPTNFELTSLASVDGSTLLLGNSGGEGHLDGDRVTFKTTTKQNNFSSQRAYRALLAVQTLDDKNWVAVGTPVSAGFRPTPTDELYTNAKARAIYTGDGGATWKPSSGSEGVGCLRAMAYRKGQPLLAVGDKGAIFTSEDKGIKWTTVESPTDKDLHAVAWGPGTPPMAVAVGQNGTVIVSHEGAKKWVAAPVKNGVSFTGLAIAGDAIVAVTGEGTILRIALKDLIHQAATQPAGK
jgi:photosystem II stability/assembly factor-like uncharacterized protein